MKKEKVLHINLPDGAEYRRVEVTDSGISIIYAGEIADDIVKVSKTVSKVIPKPAPLFGGTDVYQKDNGTGYWYCKIKEGRDEFMHVYFKDLTEKDLLYHAEGKKRKFTTDKQKKFKTDVLKALENKPVEGFRWLPVYEPSKYDDGNLQYVSGESVLRELNNYKWEEILQNYSSENESQMTSITTYFLLLLRWLKDGVATVEQLADDSKEIGHYWNSENAKHDFEKTGERQFGGLYGFVGNTCKLVKDSESGSGFSVLGGLYDFYGDSCPLADVVCDDSPDSTLIKSVGLLELKK